MSDTPYTDSNVYNTGLFDPARRVFSSKSQQVVLADVARRIELERDTLKARLSKSIELLESAIIDFEKLEPLIGDLAPAAAKLYYDELCKIPHPSGPQGISSESTEKGC